MAIWVVVAPETYSAVVVALVVVELPTMTRLPLTVEEAPERKPPVKVERPETVSDPRVPIEVSEEDKMPLPSVLPERTEAPLIWKLPPVGKFTAAEVIVVVAVVPT